MSDSNTLSLDSKAILNGLQPCVLNLYRSWNMLRGLFGAGDKTAELLDETAEDFFRSVYHLLMRDFVLGASALTDPLKMSGKENLVIGQLSQLPEVVADTALAAVVTASLEQIRLKSAPLREYRHKYVAHYDFGKFRASDDRLTFGAEHMESLLVALADVLNHVDGLLQARRTAFEEDAGYSDVELLLLACLDAREAKGERNRPVEDRRAQKSAGATKAKARTLGDAR